MGIVWENNVWQFSLQESFCLGKLLEQRTNGYRLSLSRFPIEAAVSRGGLNASRPRLMEFCDRIHSRPAYKRALDRGGAYQLAS